MTHAFTPVFVDTAGWYALLDRDDQDHVKADKWFREEERTLLTSDYVLDETLTLARQKLGHGPAVTFGEKLRASTRTQMTAVRKQDREQAWNTFKRYEDEAFSFTDCTSFAVMKRLDLKIAFTFDKDFSIAGFETVP